MKTKIYSFVFLSFLSFVFIISIISLLFLPNLNQQKIPSRTMLLTETFDDVEWLKHKGLEDLAGRIDNSTDRKTFISATQNLTNHVALEEMGSDQLSQTAVLDLKVVVNELDKLVRKLAYRAEKGDKLYFTQYIERINGLNMKIDFLEKLAA